MGFANHSADDRKSPPAVMPPSPDYRAIERVISRMSGYTGLAIAVAVLGWAIIRFT